MIPLPLVAPPPDPGASRPGRGLLLTAAGLAVAAVVGTAVWWVLFSPFGYQRFGLFADDSVRRVVQFRQPGTYVVFEESRGAAADEVPSTLTVTVTAPGGARVPVDSLLGEQGRSPHTYRTPWHAGRAIASFEIVEPGAYAVAAFPSARGGGVPRADPATNVAVAREAAMSWLGTLWGLAALGAVPLALALVVGLAGRRRSHGSRRATEVGFH